MKIDATAPTLRGPLAALLALALGLGGCGDDDPAGPDEERAFLDGTEDDPQIGLVVNSTGRALTLFQLGDPTETREIPLGASSQVTPVGLSVRDERLAVPLGNAASVAVIDPRALRIDRFVRFEGGNATGSAFLDDESLLVGNLIDDELGRADLSGTDDVIGETVPVAPAPAAVVVQDDRAYVISSNLDESFQSLGDGVVTVLDPETLEVLGTTGTGGTNAQDAAFGPDGNLYVVNSGDFVDDGSLGVIDPEGPELVEVVEGIGVGPGSIRFGDDGLAYVSGTFVGTVVWDPATGTFVRGPDDPVCAPLEDGSCRGAFDVDLDASGRLYQAFFGSAAEGLAPWIFVYEGPSYELVDSIDVGVGPAALEIHTF